MTTSITDSELISLIETGIWSDRIKLAVVAKAYALGMDPSSAVKHAKDRCAMYANERIKDRRPSGPFSYGR